MWTRSLWRFLLSAVIGATVLVCLPRAAHAQATLTVYQETSLPRVDRDGKPATKRPLNLTPEGVNNQDCLDGQQIEFPLQMSGFVAGATITVWAALSGTDCTAQTSRSGVAQICWQLATLSPSIQQNVFIPVRKIMSGVSPGTAVAPVSDTSICGKIDLTTIDVQFLYFDPSQTATPSATQTVSIQVDTVGPLPPSGTRTLPGNTRIIVDWDNISGEGGISVLTGVRVYCDPNGSTFIPNDPVNCGALIDAGGITEIGTEFLPDASSSTAPVTDDGSVSTSSIPYDVCLSDDGAVTVCDGGASDAGDGGLDAGDGAVPACSSSNLVPASGLTIVPNDLFNKCFACGSITGNTGSSVVASTLRGQPLVNNQHYVVAVAATDAFNNVGPLSTTGANPLCEYPEETNDFWENYKKAGGEAGGGCATTTDETPFGTLGALGGTIAVAVSLLRRRRRKAR